MAWKLSLQQLGFKEAVAAIKRESDGKRLYAELRAEFKAIGDPIVQEVRSNITGMAVHGAAHRGDPLRQKISDNTKIGVNTSGRNTGVRIYVSKRGMPRNFANAPRDFNREGFEHPAGRGGELVAQVGEPDFFDKPAQAKLTEFREAIIGAYERMLDRIAKR